MTIPAVPKKIVVKTPTFRGAYPDPLTPVSAAPRLQTLLDQAIADGPGKSWPVAVSMVALDPEKDGVKPRPQAHFRGEEMHFSASFLKVAAMYSAFELKLLANTIAREVRTTLGGAMTRDDFFEAVEGDTNDEIMKNAAAKLPALKGLSKRHGCPLWRTTFDVDPAQVAEPVTFKKDFIDKHLLHMIDISDNNDAAACIHGSGYGYLNGALAAGGFLDPAAGLGIWLAGDYIGAYPKFTVTSKNDGLVGQATTTKDMVRLYTLLADLTLVDDAGASSKEMIRLLRAAVTNAHEVWIDRAFKDGSKPEFTVTHNKLGTAGLKRGPSVLSEGGFLEHTGRPTVPGSGTGRRFAVVWQNLVFENKNQFDQVAQVVDDTIRAFVK